MPPECPACLLPQHEGPCWRDPDEVKAEKHRRRVGELEAEIERLRAAIEEHSAQVTRCDQCGSREDPHDQALWATVLTADT